jgi:hypothetical protein
MGILKEGGNYSLTRILAIINYVGFWVVTAYLIIASKTWGHYEVFAVMTLGGGATTQLYNKWVNSKYNTPQGEIGKRV